MELEWGNKNGMWVTWVMFCRQHFKYIFWNEKNVFWLKFYFKVCSLSLYNTLRPRKNCCHFPDNFFKCIFLNGNVKISIKISLKFIPKGPINNIPALVQIMTWSQPGNKPLSEPKMVSLLTDICVTLPQWVNWPLVCTDSGNGLVLSG